MYRIGIVRKSKFEKTDFRRPKTYGFQSVYMTDETRLWTDLEKIYFLVDNCLDLMSLVAYFARHFSIPDFA